MSNHAVPLLTSLSVLVGAASAQDLGAEPPTGSDRYPTVITPTRMRQSLADVPSSVTVITAETLRRYGITSLPDALRLAPGMAVTRASGPDYRIGYHGTNIFAPRRMNVLIDGISVYRPAFSEVEWSQLPVAVGDIDRIEVTRGPSSAAYGPNSMLAVINIVTKNPKDIERGFAEVATGSNGFFNATGRLGMSFGNTAVGLTVNRSQDRGYDVISNSPQPHDSTRINRLNVRSRTDVSPTATLDLRAAVIRGVTEVAFADDFQTSFPDKHVADAYVGGVWTQQLMPSHEIKVRLDHARQRVRQSWASCVPTVGFLPELFTLNRANPVYAEGLLRSLQTGRPLPTGGTPADNALLTATLVAIQRLGPRAIAPTCGIANQDSLETRTDLEVQDTYVASEGLRLVGGLGVRHQRGASQTYLGGERSSTLHWVFGSAEYRPATWVTFNGGGYAERNTLTGSTFSPRLGASVHLSPSQTVRFVYSKGTRSPDIQEQQADWTYTATDLNPPLNGSTTGRLYQSAVSPGNLVSERVASREIGYLLNAHGAGLVLDVKVFEDDLTRLVSERGSIIGFAPTNNNSVTLRGAEVQASLEVSPTWSGFLNYAYLDNVRATKPFERSQYSRHSGSIGTTHKIGRDWRASLAYYGNSGDGIDESRYGRWDVALSNTALVGELPWTTTVLVRRLDNRATSYTVGRPAPLTSTYDSKLQIFGQISIRIP